MRMTFGKYKGINVKNVPPSYLKWALENVEPNSVASGKKLFGVIRSVVSGETEDDNELENLKKKLRLMTRAAAQYKDRAETAERKLAGFERNSAGDLDREFLSKWYRTAARVAHPDCGGDEKVMKLLNDLKDTLKI